MKKYYLRNNFPIKTNCPIAGDKPILQQEENESNNNYIQRCEVEYKRLCKERNEEIEKEQARQEEEMRPVRERNKLINQRMRKIAEQQLIEEGIINGK